MANFKVTQLFKFPSRFSAYVHGLHGHKLNKKLPIHTPLYSHDCHTVAIEYLIRFIDHKVLKYFKLG